MPSRLRNGEKVGEESETVVKKALDFLKSQRFIQGYEYADGMGFDFLVHGHQRKPVKLEVKSSMRGLHEHRKKGYRTPVVVVKRAHHTRHGMNERIEQQLILAAVERIRKLLSWNWLQQRKWERKRSRR